MSLNQGDVLKTGLGSTRIRCVVVDDHALLRQGVRRLLQDEADFEVVDEAGNGTDALKMVLQHRPDGAQQLGSFVAHGVRTETGARFHGDGGHDLQ